MDLRPGPAAPIAGAQAAVTVMVCQPVAPSGATSVRSSGWVAPVPSVARTEIVYRPARAGVQGPTVTTFRALGPLAPLAIDHVLLPQGWEGAKSLRPEFGSDHRGVLVGLDGPVGPDPQAPANR